MANNYPRPPQGPPPNDNGDHQPQPNRESERMRLEREEHRVARAQRSAVARKFEQAVYYLVGALELLLALRFLLRLTGANPENTFAQVIYGLSNSFVKPFSTLFISPTFNGNQNIFDINLLVAMISYLVLMGLLIWLVRIIESR